MKIFKNCEILKIFEFYVLKNKFVFSKFLFLFAFFFDFIDFIVQNHENQVFPIRDHKMNAFLGLLPFIEPFSCKLPGPGSEGLVSGA